MEATRIRYRFSWLKVLFTVLSVPVFRCQESVNHRLLFSCFPPQQQFSGKDES